MLRSTCLTEKCGIGCVRLCKALLMPRNVISNQRRSVPPRLGAEIQLTPRRYNHAISCKIKHPKMQRKKAAEVGNSLQRNIFAQTLGIASPFNLPSQCKTCSPAPFSSLSGQDGNQRSTLAFRPLCSVLSQPVYSMSPSRVKRRKNRKVFSRLK